LLNKVNTLETDEEVLKALDSTVVSAVTQMYARDMPTIYDPNFESRFTEAKAEEQRSRKPMYDTLLYGLKDDNDRIIR